MSLFRQLFEHQHLEYVCEIKLIKSSRLTIRDSSFDHKVTSSVIIILKIEVSPAAQPQGTPIFKPRKGPRSEENDCPRYQKAGSLRVAIACATLRSCH